MTEPITRAAVLMAAADEARRIAQRCRDNARAKTGDDRKHWHATAAGASMVAIRLTELADTAGQETTP